MADVVVKGILIWPANSADRQAYNPPMLDPHTPAVLLAPMEGVTDAPMRHLLAAEGGFTFAVAEFARVTHTPLPAHVLRRLVPELDHAGRTPTGLPVLVQLLGGDPHRLAESAATAVRAGAPGIDLNFGCPARTVNRHDGGAVLLKSPDRVFAIVRAVRGAVPPHLPVSAKLRLGWDDPRAILDTAPAAADGGAAWLTIHARTRAQGYAPPADWPLVGLAREVVRVPVVANGDIHTLDAFRRCREQTGCRHFMLGRGAVADPALARRVAAELGLHAPPPLPPGPVDWAARVRQLLALVPPPFRPDGELRRVKQWLRMAAGCGTFGRFDAIKRATDLGELLDLVDRTDADLPPHVCSPRPVLAVG